MVAMARQETWRAMLVTLASVALGACSTWKVQRRFERWILHTDRERPVEVEAYRAAFTPAFTTVEGVLGRFESQVDVYAWDGRSRAPNGTSDLDLGEPGLSEDVPGIGPARVRAFHARGRGWLGARSGVYIESPDVGTAVHELV